MSKVSADEVKKIAEMTKLRVAESDFNDIVNQLGEVLAYAERVQEIAKEVDIPSNKNINHDREDSVASYNSRTILDQAPQEEDNYFVVPKILDN